MFAKQQENLNEIEPGFIIAYCEPTNYVMSIEGGNQFVFHEHMRRPLSLKLWLSLCLFATTLNLI